ncbi:MAG: hypothetical protein JSS44_03795 [Proteobacteria bacterium]|nr:hypothetical protein [Pseudomonadota bacterium]
MNPWAHVLAAREPRPQLLGSEIEPYPYISAYGLLVRVSRLMALEPSEWFQTLGIRCSTAPLRDLRIGRVARDRFEAAMGLAGTQVTTWWQEEIWSPLQTDGILDRIMRPIRTCLKCAEHGYHTSLFQLPSIYACPWHGCSLTDRCRRCDKPATTHIDEDGRLGRCSCGLDSFNVNQATIGGYSGHVKPPFRTMGSQWRVVG